MSVHIKVAHCTIHRSIVRIRTYVYIVLVSRLAHVYIDLLVCRAALNFAMERLILLAAIVAVASAAAARSTTKIRTRGPIFRTPARAAGLEDASRPSKFPARTQQKEMT